MAIGKDKLPQNFFISRQDKADLIALAKHFGGTMTEVVRGAVAGLAKKHLRGAKRPKPVKAYNAKWIQKQRAKQAHNAAVAKARAKKKI